MKDLAGAVDLGMLLKARVRPYRRDMRCCGVESSLSMLVLDVEEQKGLRRGRSVDF